MSKRHKTGPPDQASSDGVEVDPLSALGELLGRGCPELNQYFDHGLKILVQHLGVDRAVMVRVTDLGFEASWWATAEGIAPGQAISCPAMNFCPGVLQNPSRTLIVKDALTDKDLQNHFAFRTLGVRAYLGVALQRSDQTIGILSVQSSRPKAFTRGEVTLLKTVASLFSAALEIEQLKVELKITRDALDLTTAVVEDSALETADTRLPNRRYLDIWLKANLFFARRASEPMSVVRWSLPVQPESRKVLRKLAEASRGEDLLVDLGRDEFLYLLPRTGVTGAEILLERIRARIGPIPMGATLWQPMDKTDSADPSIQHATRRALKGLDRSREAGSGGCGAVTWELLPLSLQDLRRGIRPSLPAAVPGLRGPWLRVMEPPLA
jgi:hypothetical protein